MKTKILALGDSWFHYPRGLDKDGNPILFFTIRRWLGLIGDKGVGNIVCYLKNRNKIPIDSRETTVDQLVEAKFPSDHSADDVLGQCGEELMVMAYGHTRSNPHNILHKPTWLEVLEKRVSNDASSCEQFVILLSGGGNDIADENLLAFLNDNNPATPVNSHAFNEALQELKDAYLEIFNRIGKASGGKNVHFVLHGYGYPPVNGRGVFMALEKSKIKMLHKLSPGPWLKPNFEKKGIYKRPLQDEIIGDFIDKFNNMVQGLTPPLTNVKLHYADLRHVIDKINRDKGWCNELHFDHHSYVEAANTIYKIIQPLL